MMNVHLLVAVVFAAGTFACPSPTPAPLTPRPLEIHTCVANADVWLDGALMPDPPQHIIADVEGVAAMPSVPAAASAFNVHARATNYPEYGAVIHTAAAPGERIIVFLGSCTR